MNTWNMFHILICAGFKLEISLHTHGAQIWFCLVLWTFHSSGILLIPLSPVWKVYQSIETLVYTRTILSFSSSLFVSPFHFWLYIVFFGLDSFIIHFVDWYNFLLSFFFILFFKYYIFIFLNILFAFHLLFLCLSLFFLDYQYVNFIPICIFLTPVIETFFIPHFHTFFFWFLNGLHFRPSSLYCHVLIGYIIQFLVLVTNFWFILFYVLFNSSLESSV